MTGEPAHATLEERMVPGLLFSSEQTSQLSIIEIAKWPLCFVFSYVQPVKNEEHYLYKRRVAITQHYYKSTTCVASRDKSDTKEDTGKSMTYALYICGIPKGTCQAEATSNSNKIKLVAD